MNALLHSFRRQLTLMNSVSQRISVILQWFDSQMATKWNAPYSVLVYAEKDCLHESSRGAVEGAADVRSE